MLRPDLSCWQLSRMRRARLVRGRASPRRLRTTAWPSRQHDSSRDGSVPSIYVHADRQLWRYRRARGAGWSDVDLLAHTPTSRSIDAITPVGRQEHDAADRHGAATFCLVERRLGRHDAEFLRMAAKRAHPPPFWQGVVEHPD